MDDVILCKVVVYCCRNGFLFGSGRSLEMVRAKAPALKLLRSHKTAMSLTVMENLEKKRINIKLYSPLSASLRRGKSKLKLKTKFPIALRDNDSGRCVEGNCKILGISGQVGDLCHTLRYTAFLKYVSCWFRAKTRLDCDMYADRAPFY
jgi:hypothetical protein